MERSTALKLLTGLQKAQNAFHAGGEDAELRILLLRDKLTDVLGADPLSGSGMAP